VVHNGSAPRPASDDKRDIILAAGRWWDEAKNLAALDEAARTSLWPVEIVGPLTGPNGAQAPEPRSVLALGPLEYPEMQRRLGEAAVFVSTALYEPFGLGVLEAAMGGATLVLSDIATFRELWDDAALFVDPHDPAAIARGLNRIAGEPALRAALGKAARQRARRYDLEAQAINILAAYREATVARVAAAPAT
jgi:glycogen(starch) synthase